MGLFGGDNGAKKEAKKARAREEEAERKNRQLERERKQKIRQGRANVDAQLSAFDDNYYQGITDRYVQNYIPQLDKQFTRAQGEVASGLAQQGLLGSSLSLDKTRDLSKDYTKARSGIADAGVNEGIDAENTIENSRQDLYGRIEAGLSPTDAAGEVSRVVGNAAAPVEYSQLGDVFAGTVGNLSTLISAEARGYNGTGLGIYGRSRKGGSTTTVG